MQISARNQIQAEIVSVDSQNVNANILLKLKSGKELLSTITKEAVENLHIEENQTVIAICKSSAVLLTKKVDEERYENRLEGIVSKIDKDLDNTKVVVDIGHHDTIVSVMPTAVLDKMELIEGSSVIAMIKANDIMIGK